MKKSRIIVPAMAVIAFSTAASIAGSVAWFTASRQVTINAGSYAVVKTTSNLTVTLGNGVGTTVSNNNVTFTGLLTDASFNHNKTSYQVFVPNGAGTAIEKAVNIFNNDNLESDLTRVTLENTTKVYSAATFDVTFTMDIGGEHDIGLFLNTTAGQSAFTNTSGGDSLDTAKGFRMAIVPKGTAPTGSSQVAKVFADLQSSTNCKYVSGTGNINGTDYAATDLMDSAYNAALPSLSDARDDVLARPDYLGFFRLPENPTSSSVTLAYTVVAWFEGTDPEIVNRDLISEYKTVSSKLVFDAVDIADAA